MRRTHRSDVIKKGRTRAPHRAFMHAMGLTDADITKPFVAVMGPYGELTPCNLHIGALMKAVKTGIAEAGGLGRESGMAMVADSLSMNHQGMKFSLISRELIADSIEAVVRGHSFDALVGIAGCDKSPDGHGAMQRALGFLIRRQRAARTVSGKGSQHIGRLRGRGLAHRREDLGRGSQ